jgi:hypothetical protein
MKTVRSNPIAKVAAVSALTLGLLSTAHAISENADFKAKIRLLTPIIFTSVTDLNFGDVIQGSTADYTVAADTADAAALTITGLQSTTVTLTLASPNITMTLDGVASGGDATKEINVGAFTYGASVSGGQATFDSNGDLSVSIGATASVLSTNVAGDYEALNNLTVAYL